MPKLLIVQKIERCKIEDDINSFLYLVKLFNYKAVSCSESNLQPRVSKSIRNVGSAMLESLESDDFPGLTFEQHFAQATTHDVQLQHL
jgi:hypothetical protein